MSKRSIRKVPLWRLALRFGGIFIIVVMLIQLVGEFVSSGNLNAIAASLQNGKWVVFAISKVILGVVYGFTMAYFTKKNAKK